MLRTADPPFNGPSPSPPSLREFGWPYLAYAECAVRAEDARLRAQAAAVAGDRGARVRAELDRDDAIGDLQKLKQHVSDVWLAGLRATLELQPEALALLLDRMPVPHQLRDAVEAVEDEVTAAKLAVTTLAAAVGRRKGAA